MAHRTQAEHWSEFRVFLSAVGKVEHPMVIQKSGAITRSQRLECNLVLTHDGRLVIDQADETGKPTEVQLTREQYSTLMDAFRERASPNVRERVWVRPKRKQKAA